MALMNLGSYNGVPVLKSMLPDDSEVASYIIAAAKKRGIDPQTALKVWSHEGRGAWQSTYMKNGQREPSYSPFQLYKGGGLGNRMQKDTGLDPADPKNWRQSVDYALDEAAVHGWSQWYGAKRAGITGMMGINGNPGRGAEDKAYAGLNAPQLSATGNLSLGKPTLAQSPLQAGQKGVEAAKSLSDQVKADQTANKKGFTASFNPANFAKGLKTAKKPSFGPLMTAPMMGGLSPEQMAMVNDIYRP